MGSSFEKNWKKYTFGGLMYSGFKSLSKRMKGPDAPSSPQTQAASSVDVNRPRDMGAVTEDKKRKAMLKRMTTSKPGSLLTPASTTGKTLLGG